MEASILWSHDEETRELVAWRKRRNNVRCTQARRPHTACMDNIKTWTGLTMEESIRMAWDRDKVRSWCCQPSDRGRLNNRTKQTGLPDWTRTTLLAVVGALLATISVTLKNHWRLLWTTCMLEQFFVLYRPVAKSVGSN